MATKKTRGENGRYLPGNPGGPGRPPQRKRELLLTNDELHELGRLNGPGLWWAAESASDREAWLVKIKAHFPAAAAARAENLARLADLATEELRRRLIDDVRR